MEKTKREKYTCNKNWGNKSKYKKGFGSLQEGHRLSHLQKNRLKKEYLKLKNRELREESSRQEYREQRPSVILEAPPEEREAFDALSKRTKKSSKFKKVQREFEMRQKQKINKREEREIRRKEIENRKKEYKERKLRRNVKLSKKTRKGQPLMKARMELLLETLEKTLVKER